MPVRPATRRDIPIMAHVVAASFAPDALFRTFFPYLDDYWADYERAIGESLWLAWYDYKSVLMVSYAEEAGDETTALLPQARAAAATAATTKTGGRITGVAEWQRSGRGWERVHGAWGAWDPRLLVKPLLAWYYGLRRRLVGNRAATGPSGRKPDPGALTLWNFAQQSVPYSGDLFAAPHRQTHWLLNTLAVDPAEQGRGYGRELVLDGLQRLAVDHHGDGDATPVDGSAGDAAAAAADDGKLPVGVVSADGKETFYQKQGFKLLVGWTSRIVGADGSDNPLKRNGVGGGAVLWTR